MQKTFISIFNYYKPMALWSFLVTLYIISYKPEFSLVVLTKFCLIVLLWLLIKDVRIRQKLRFYRIVGVSDFKFFGTLFLIDSIITCSFLALIKFYI